jgi:hypothetical protein
LVKDPLYTFAATTFYPIAQLNRTDADVILNFIGHNATYTNPVNDPWFLATIPHNTSIGGLNPDSVLYYPNQVVTVVGCTEQHQIRNPRTQQISVLGGAEILTRNLTQLVGFDQNQIALFNRSFMPATGYVLNLIISSLGSTSMIAQSFNSLTGVSAPLPDDQWIQEFSHWFGTVLVAMQFHSLQYVIGRSQQIFNQYLAPVEDENQWMCYNQVIVRDDYTSFSILGMFIVLSVGSVFIISSFVLPALVTKIQNSTSNGRFRNMEWKANHFYELQRRAYENMGDGDWESEDKKFAIPFDEIKLAKHQ